MPQNNICKNPTIFCAERIPDISIHRYLYRIVKYTECTIETLIQSIIHLIITIQYHNTNFIIDRLNIHRLLLTCILCTSKFFDDTHFNNEFYAKIGGIGVRELNCLEIEFLALINFDLFVTFERYEKYYIELLSQKLHTCCNCSYLFMPKLLCPEITKELDIEWNIDSMMDESMTEIKINDNK